jgi:hypothetical protein
MVPIRETIRKLGAAEIAATSGFPLTTICRWRDEDRIPGKGRAHEWRVREFEAAVARINANDGEQEPAPVAEARQPTRPKRRRPADDRERAA